MNTFIPNTYIPPIMDKTKSIPTYTPTPIPSYLISPTCSDMFMYDAIPKCSHILCNSQIEIKSITTTTSIPEPTVIINN